MPPAANAAGSFAGSSPIRPNATVTPAAARSSATASNARIATVRSVVPDDGHRADAAPLEPDQLRLLRVGVEPQVRQPLEDPRRRGHDLGAGDHHPQADVRAA